jgi:CYTH domain-containing protein
LVVSSGLLLFVVMLAVVFTGLELAGVAPPQPDNTADNEIREARVKRCARIKLSISFYNRSHEYNKSLKMNKTAPTEFYRLFLIDRLPEPLTPASSHLQLFDNYIENTRLRLRKIRDPYSNSWTWSLQQHIRSTDGEHPFAKLSEIHLNEAEYGVFERFEGREIRKNRYFHEFDQSSFTFDVYLGSLFGFCTARVDFEARENMDDLVPPPFAAFDVTSDEFFNGENLVTQRFSDVRDHVSKISSTPEVPDE